MNTKESLEAMRQEKAHTGRLLPDYEPRVDRGTYEPYTLVVGAACPVCGRVYRLGWLARLAHRLGAHR